MSYDYEVLEGDEVDEQEYAIAMQKNINSGVGWKMQGSVGRAMMDALEAGICMLGIESARDYYGNYIPCRADVKEGTKGSYQYVVDAKGAEWAEMMANVNS